MASFLSGGLFAALFVAFSAVIYILRKEKGQGIKKRIHVRQRKDSGYAASLLNPAQPEKQPQDAKAPDYSSTVPPSQRSTLNSIMPYWKLWKSLIKTFSSRPGEMGRMLPMGVSYLDAEGSMTTPCGFSVDEIKALGDFPDYAKLSGMPLPKPYQNFDISKALPRPYRPFRWAYHQTMSLIKLEPDWWLELENTYKERVKQRQDLFAEHRESVLQVLPGSELACKELMEMALQFLCARYPHHFALDDKSMLFHNAILGTKTELNTTHPLRVLLDNVPEDFGIMLRDERTGRYRLRAGVICSALGWNIGTKIGLQLHEIHAPIPDYKEKMQFSMDRYFAKMPTDKGIQRGSWGLEVDQPLFMPPGDAHAKHRTRQMPDLELSRCHLRVDWQTLRRLPLSGAIVFNFKALFTPVEDFRYEPFIPGLLLKVLNEGKESLMVYKSAWHTEHVVKSALERFNQEQVDAGLVPEGWEPHTLSESPWFPGWEGQWHQKQGF